MFWSGTVAETEQQVAVKSEDAQGWALQLEHEVQALMDLAKPALQQGIVGCLYVGRAGPYICMVMELLGTSLENRKRKHGQKFKVPIACLVA